MRAEIILELMKKSLDYVKTYGDDSMCYYNLGLSDGWVSGFFDVLKSQKEGKHTLESIQSIDDHKVYDDIEDRYVLAISKKGWEFAKAFRKDNDEDYQSGLAEGWSDGFYRALKIFNLLDGDLEAFIEKIEL